MIVCLAMGKVKRSRQKFHVAVSKRALLTQRFESPTETKSPESALPVPSDDLFAGLHIDISTLKTKLNSDAHSVKSFKSTKSEKSGQNIMPKKDKLRLRREVLMKKIDAVNHMKKNLKIREKRKTIAIMGDTNPLHDALPSLESLLKNRPSAKKQAPVPRKPKAIEKADRRKKELIQGIKIFKSVLKNKHFRANPLEAISKQVQAVVAQQQMKQSR
uniref:Ribosome biogenesis protein SLX9 n=2 Tax=Dendroctonus ponderosae TaxID=77166 RepID=A0AAR5P9Q3_DENPD